MTSSILPVTCESATRRTLSLFNFIDNVYVRSDSEVIQPCWEYVYRFPNDGVHLHAGCSHCLSALLCWYILNCLGHFLNPCKKSCKTGIHWRWKGYSKIELWVFYSYVWICMYLTAQSHYPNQWLPIASYVAAILQALISAIYRTKWITTVPGFVPVPSVATPLKHAWSVLTQIYQRCRTIYTLSLLCYPRGHIFLYEWTECHTRCGIFRCNLQRKWSSWNVNTDIYISNAETRHGIWKWYWFTFEIVLNG